MIRILTHSDKHRVRLTRLWAILVLLLAVPPSYSAPQWIKVTSPNFEMFTSAGEGAAKRTLQDFEQIRSFFIEVTQAKSAPPLPVRIIAFRSRKEFEPYRARESSSAYYLSSRERDYIVMGKIGADTRPIAIHEYIHLLVRHSGLKLPIWLNEGFADLYSTLKPYAGKILVGELLPGRFQVLQRTKWLPLETLTAVDHESAHYNEKDRAGLFYAQSWALTHMLNLSEQYRSGFHGLLTALAKEQDAKDAFLDLYGKPLDRVEKDLRLYLKSNRFTGALFDAKLEKLADKPTVQLATELESGLVLANLLAQKRKDDQAQEMYEALAAKYPDAPEIPAAIGYLATYTSGWDAAEQHFARAAELGSTNAKLLYDYAQILSRKNRKAPEIESLLRKAIELRNNYQEARYRLAFYLYGREQFARALIEFARLENVTSKQAFSLYQAVAHAFYRLGRKQKARKNIQLAKAHAKSPDQISRFEDLVQWMDRSDKADEQKRIREAAGTDQSALTSLDGLDDPRRLQEGSRAGGHPSVRTSDDGEFFADEMPRLKRGPSPADGPSRGGSGEVELVLGGPATRYVEGNFTSLDCLGEQARLWLATGTGELALVIADPNAIIMQNSAAVDLTCGPRDPKTVKIEYKVKEDAKLKTAGEIISIEFR